MDTRFDFDFEARFRPLLLMLGVAPRTSLVRLDDTELDVRFGPWAFSTPVSNISGVHMTGPYRWYTAIGARGSFADRGLTFGTTTRGGVCLVFHHPVPGLEPTGRMLHPGLTLTVAEPRRFADAVLARMAGDGAAHDSFGSRTRV
ncbi:MAG: hypothetical protein R3A49_04965 [Acidimicrobiia bacterium]